MSKKPTTTGRAAPKTAAKTAAKPAAPKPAPALSEGTTNLGADDEDEQLGGAVSQANTVAAQDAVAEINQQRDEEIANVVTEAEEKAAKARRNAKDARTVGVERVKIILDDNDNIPPSGLPISVNGRSYILKSGVEANVPVGVLDVLDHAITSAPIKDNVTGKIVGTRDRPVYTYRKV